jgi:hypothetical protein
MQDAAQIVPQLTIVVPSEDVENVRSQLAAVHVDVMEAETKGFDGTALVELIVPLTGITVPALVSLYKARMAAKAHTTYKENDFEVTGVSEAALLEIVRLHQKRIETR